MTKDSLPILPSTKVASLLEHHPELEEVLISIAPPFKKLRNPILRRSVAKIASLSQASAVARLPVLDVVNRLREAVGQTPLADGEGDADVQYFGPEPEWFASCELASSVDARESSEDDGEMTVNQVVRQAKQLAPGQMVELVTTFLPAPGIDLMKAKGYRVWPRDEEGGLVRTYFTPGS